MAFTRAFCRPSCPRWFWFAVLAFAIALSASTYAASGEVKVVPAPDWVRGCDWSMPTNSLSAPHSEGTRYLVYERQEHAQLAQDYTRLVLLMENETGVQDYGNLRFRFDPSYQTLQLHSVRIHRSGKVLDRLDQSKLRIIQPEPGLSNGVLTGDKTAVVLVEDLRAGDVLEYAFTLAGANPVLAGHYSQRWAAQSSVPVDHQRFRLIWPSEKKLLYRQSAGVRAPAIESRKSLTEYVWQWENLNAIPYEDRVPPSMELYPIIELSDFTNWASVVEWGVPLYDAAKAGLPSELFELINKWREQPSAELRARAAVQFVQNEVRYTGLMDGLGSHHPAAPADTFEKRYGDCKGKAFLLCAILEQMDIPAWPALVSYSLRGGITESQPSPFVFDHVIVKMDLKGTNAWVDATRSQQGGDLFHRIVHRFGYALVLAKGQTDLEPVPSAHLFGQQQVTSIFRIPDYTNPATLVVRSTYSGWKAEDMRSYLHQKDPQKLATDYLNFYSKYYPGIRVKRPAEIDDDLSGDVLRVVEYYEIPGMWKRDPKSNRVKAEFYAESMIDMLTEPSVRTRTLPLQITHPLNYEHHTFVKMPDNGWKVPAAKEHIKDDAFTFDYERRSTPSQVEFIYRCNTLEEQVPPIKLGVYLENVAKMENLLGDTLYQATGLHNTTARFNWLLLFVMFACFGAVGGYWFWIRRTFPLLPPPWQPSTPEEAKLTGLGGWLILVGFGVCLRPFIITGQIATDWQAYFSMDVWDQLTSPSSGFYHPFAAPFTALQLAANSIVLGLSVMLVSLFFSKRRAFKTVFIVTMAAAVLNVTLAELGAALIPPFKASSNPSACVSMFINAIIWSLYMVRSRRVELTFTR